MHCSLFSRLGAASVLSACLCAAVAMFPATGATANELYNFNMSPGGWISGGTPGWEWSRPSPNSNKDSWKAFCTGIVSTSYLYSPCLEVRTPSGTPAGRVDVDFKHRFRFEDNPGGTYPPSTSITNPQGAGQVQFMLNNSGIWQGIKTWDSGGSEIVPQFFSGSPTYVPPLANPGLSFVGTSPKYGNTPKGGGNFNESSFLISGLTDGDKILFRFVAAMFTDSCPKPLPDPLVQNPLWDVNRFQIKGAVECVPEPGSVILAATGLLAGLGSYSRRRFLCRQSQPS
jgi:hypothetical protein